MKKAFSGYYTPSESEFKELWAKARIIVDANVLLTLYGISEATREALLSLLESVKERLWIPHQFALEYQRNRLGKILEQVKHYEDAHRTLKSILDDHFRSRTRHPFVSEQVEKGLEEICKNLLDGKTEQEKLLHSDPLFVRTTELFEDRVGAPYNDTELAQAYDTARKRFSEKTPPGFKDSDKPEPMRFGDYVGWRQILDFVVKNKVAVILVTDDGKEDWWRREGGETFGPRPELVVEFRSCCSDLFYMYSSDRFLEFSQKYIGGSVDPRAISELKERRESEPPPDAKKPIGINASDSMAIKPVAYSSDGDLSEAKSVSDTPKLVARDSVKPEGE
jgi:PIN like domain